LINCFNSANKPFETERCNVCAAQPIFSIFIKEIAFLILAPLSVVAAKHFSFKFQISRIEFKQFLIFSDVYM